jgi:hypothetical protein
MTQTKLLPAAEEMRAAVRALLAALDIADNENGPGLDNDLYQAVRAGARCHRGGRGIELTVARLI